MFRFVMVVTLKFNQMKPQTKVAKVMHEFKQGQLKSHGKKVTDRDQAIAIALSEAGISKEKAIGGTVTVLPYMFNRGGLMEWLNEKIF